MDPWSHTCQRFWISYSRTTRWVEPLTPKMAFNLWVVYPKSKIESTYEIKIKSYRTNQHNCRTSSQILIASSTALSPCFSASFGLNSALPPQSFQLAKEKPSRTNCFASNNYNAHVGCFKKMCIKSHMKIKMSCLK